MTTSLLADQENAASRIARCEASRAMAVTRRSAPKGIVNADGWISTLASGPCGNSSGASSDVELGHVVTGPIGAPADACAPTASSADSDPPMVR
jgi:hypothetical protein